nr:hypothetical protein OG409_10600 [Streptomyces sp. NBC_00974]
MGQKTTPATGTAPEPDREPRKKLDLSAAQVAGSSLATVAAALLASKMGVYGTILGAGVVSVVATAGGPVIQHVFRRTGDQLRESARPRARQVPVSGPREEPAQEPAEERAPDGTMVLREVPLASAPPAGLSEEFGAATVHGSRVRGVKRTMVASGLVFALVLGGLGTYEAIADTSVSKGGGTLFSVGTQKAGRDKPAPPGGGTDEKGKGGTDPETGNSPSPSRPDGSRSPGAPDPDSSPSPDASPGPSATPSKQDPKPTPSPTPPPSSGKATPGGDTGSGAVGGSDSGSGQGSQTP